MLSKFMIMISSSCDLEIHLFDKKASHYIKKKKTQKLK